MICVLLISFKSRAMQLYTPLCWSVGPLVRPSVTLYFFLVFAIFSLIASAQMIKWPQIRPLPPARDWGSRVSGLVSYIWGFFGIFAYFPKNSLIFEQTCSMMRKWEHNFCRLTLKCVKLLEKLFTLIIEHVCSVIDMLAHLWASTLMLVCTIASPES